MRERRVSERKREEKKETDIKIDRIRLEERGNEKAERRREIDLRLK